MPAQLPTPSWAKPETLNAQTTSISKSKPSGGSWLSLGVAPNLSRALNLRGFKSPTPIQRTTLPATLATPPRDVLGMARTGSGKTLAYLIPLVQRLLGTPSSAKGPRALLLSPTRELALQVLKVGKDLARGVSKESGGHTLKWALIMGGDGLDSQFEALSNEPDIIIATPGRLLHVMVEMNYDLRTIEMIIYDEADRLFEMGFEVQLHEILHRLPSSRQNLLFSATLPSAVAEFAKAGLVNPLLLRLDSEQKISEDLQLTFFDIKSSMKDAALLALLEHILKIPTNRDDDTKAPQAIVFVSTKHHVEYITNLLQLSGYRTNHIYGSLDQIARQRQLAGFRSGSADLLVVTDVAARGIDIPVMDNVINYDFPAGVKNFVHRVGRTARAGRKGRAWSLVTREDAPYLVELGGFLGKKLLQPSGDEGNHLWKVPQEVIDQKIEQISALDEVSGDLANQRAVMERGTSMFERSRAKVSSRSHKEAKEKRTASDSIPLHPEFPFSTSDNDSQQQQNMLAAIQAFTPSETILEIGNRGLEGNAKLMTARRRTAAQRHKATKEETVVAKKVDSLAPSSLSSKARTPYRDEQHYISHTRARAAEEEGYSMKDPNFVDQVRSATFDVGKDEGSTLRPSKPSQLKWDRKKKRMVATNEIGADNKKMIRSESGAILPASYKSGRYAEWRKSRKSSGRDQSYTEPHDTERASQNFTKSGLVNIAQTSRSKTLKRARSELKSTTQIMKARRVAEKRKEKNARPQRGPNTRRKLRATK